MKKTITAMLVALIASGSAAQAGNDFGWGIVCTLTGSFYGCHKLKGVDKNWTAETWINGEAEQITGVGK